MIFLLVIFGLLAVSFHLTVGSCCQSRQSVRSFLLVCLPLLHLTGTHDPTTCPDGRWGRDCQNKCECVNGASCDPFSGECRCTRGWRGKECSEECPPTHYGQDCGEECRCMNGSIKSLLQQKRVKHRLNYGIMARGVKTCVLKESTEKNALMNVGVKMVVPAVRQLASAIAHQDGRGMCVVIAVLRGHGAATAVFSVTATTEQLVITSQGIASANLVSKGTGVYRVAPRANTVQTAPITAHVRTMPHVHPSMERVLAQTGGWESTVLVGSVKMDCLGINAQTNCKTNCKMYGDWYVTVAGVIHGQECVNVRLAGTDKRARDLVPSTSGAKAVITCATVRMMPNAHLSTAPASVQLVSGEQTAVSCVHQEHLVRTVHTNVPVRMELLVPQKMAVATVHLAGKVNNVTDLAMKSSSARIAVNIASVSTMRPAIHRMLILWLNIVYSRDGDTFLTSVPLEEQVLVRAQLGTWASCVSDGASLAGLGSSVIKCVPVTMITVLAVIQLQAPVYANQNGGGLVTSGIRCETRCPAGAFGEDCNSQCDCHNNSSCDPQTGTCVCARGWEGVDCSQHCREGYYGLRCKEKCPDVYGNRTCDHVTGEFVCRSGYIGLTCEHPCPLGTYGLNCLKKCHCKNGADCHHVTGSCRCLPGWTGSTCATPCPVGTYGMNCSQHCKCLNGGKCRRNDGLCRCPSGWIGQQCTEICPEGYYGDHCMAPCECPNDNFVCHPADGCICRHGFTGEKCELQLSAKNVLEKEEKHYGSVAAGLVVALILVAIIVGLLFYYRRRVANLKTEIAHVQYIADPQSAPVNLRNIVVHPKLPDPSTNNKQHQAKGSFLPLQQTISGQRFLPLRQTTSGQMFLPTFTTNNIRPKVPALATNIIRPNVPSYLYNKQYQAKGSCPCDKQHQAKDRHHFDNPVYSYQTPVRSDDGANLLLNNVQKIRNDLGMKNNTNLERQKLGVPVGCEDEDNLSNKGAYGLTYEHPPSLKNRDADAGNPNLNVYHSIDDLDDRKVEHLYDEIKQKEGQGKDLGKC
uniref:EGF-like domain-containing protein n=1 Tax=Timema monikensis TaxID=170555 RepID=A0A7R9EGY6_9NEOP|nr:unnamed protein product [Timema monikensis]